MKDSRWSVKITLKNMKCDYSLLLIYGEQELRRRKIQNFPEVLNI